MIKINDNFELNANIEDVLYKIKREYLIKFDINIFNVMKDKNGNIQTTCPFHKEGKEKKPSFGINKETGMYHCFSCNASGSLISLVKNTLNIKTYELAKQWLIDSFPSTIYVEDEIPMLEYGIPKTNKKQTITVAPKKYVSNEELKSYRYYHQYMYDRGLTNEIIKNYDIGFDLNFKLQIGKQPNGEPVYGPPIPCITFPIKDEKGNCVFVARRAVNTKFFYYPDGVEKPLYGLYEMKQTKRNITELWICESMLDALKYNAYNENPNRYCVALNGIGSDLQIKQINNSEILNIVIAMDNDNSGKDGAKTLASRIKHKFIQFVKIPKYKIKLPNGKTGYTKDINDLTPEQINKLEPQPNL